MEGIALCGERVALGVRAVGVPCPSSKFASTVARPGSDVSMPSAVPDLEPASGTMSIGARARFSWPDLMRLFVTVSLFKSKRHTISGIITRAIIFAHRISAIRSSIAYHATGPYAMPRNQPVKSAGAMYAWACRWSVTGILPSQNGGVMKPIRKLGFGRYKGAEDAEVGAETGVLGGSMLFNSRVAKFLILTRSGRSVEDYGDEITPGRE